METPIPPHDDDGQEHDDEFRELFAVDPIMRAAAAATLGLRHTARAQHALAGLILDDPDGRVRSAALAALCRINSGSGAVLDAWDHARVDPDPAVRRRAYELTPRLGAGTRGAEALVAALDDAVGAEVAAWALGELGGDAIAAGAVAALAALAAGADDPLVRESAVAALGALGDPGGLAAILAACTDKPAIRRRAILALAPFSGPHVEAAIDHALADKDWQVRQVAEDLRNADR